MTKLKSTNSYVRYALIGLCLALFLIIFLIRTSPIGTEPYLYLRLSEEPRVYDELSLGGRFFPYIALPFILSMLPHWLVKIFPLVIGLLSVVLFVFLLEKFFAFEPEKQSRTEGHGQDLRRNARVINFSLLVLVSSPGFIYLFSSLNRYFFPFFLSLLGFCLYLSKYKSLKYSGLGLFIVLQFFSLPIAIISLLLLYLYCNTRKTNKDFNLAAIISFAVGIFYYGLIVYNSGFEFVFLQGYSFNDSLQGLISDLGGMYGIGIFSLVFCIVGILKNWGQKYKFPFIFFSFISLLIVSFLRIEAVLYLTLFVAVFAAHGIVYLMKRKWESETIKTLIVIVFFCGLAFSALSEINRAVNEEPHKSTIDAIGFLAVQSKGTVFSHYSRGHWITFAGHESVTDENFYFAPDINERLLDSANLFKTRSLGETLWLINKYGIDYIWIDSWMKDNIWETDEEGLLFILQYSRRFVKVYDNGDVEIWRVVG